MNGAPCMQGKNFPAGAPEIDRAEMAAIDRVGRTKPSRFERRDHVGVRSIVGRAEVEMPCWWWDRRD
jgi:hypothetical protein